MIKFENVSKTYRSGGRPAVDSLSLEVDSGRVFGFLGPNGAGKSTTIKILVGILRQDGGRVLVDGLDNLRDGLAVKRLVGYVPDEPRLYERMTALKYFDFIADIYRIGAKERRERVEKYASLFEIEGSLGDRLSSFSHGMKQKAALVGALIREPEVLVLDEPMVGLDPRASFVLKDHLARMAREGRTVFFSTHVMEVAEKICDRVGIINEGRLVAVGSVEELKAMRGEEGSSLEKLFLELTGSEDVLRREGAEGER